MGAQILVDEADKKQQERRDRYEQFGEIPIQLQNADPAKHYKFVNKRPERVSRFEGQGYQITPASSKTRAVGRTRTAEGGQEVGDLVLMETTSENYSRRLRKIKSKQEFLEQTKRGEVRETINRIAGDSRIRGDIVFDESSES